MLGKWKERTTTGLVAEGAFLGGGSPAAFSVSGIRWAERQQNRGCSLKPKSHGWELKTSGVPESGWCAAGGGMGRGKGYRIQKDTAGDPWDASVLVTDPRTLACEYSRCLCLIFGF